MRRGLRKGGGAAQRHDVMAGGPNGGKTAPIKTAAKLML